jgi:hypothetical protein
MVGAVAAIGQWSPGAGMPGIYRTGRTNLALEGLVSPLAGLEPMHVGRPIAWDDPAALHRLERGLIEAEVKRSADRRALHERIDDCTAQLVGHDQRDPAQLAEIVPR